MLKELGEPVLPILQEMLDASWLRQQVISHNLANVDTPNYKRWDVVFEGKLQENSSIPLRQTNPRHLSGNPPETGKARLVRPNQTSVRNDGNNVDLEAEMAAQAANTLQYNLLTRLVSDQLGMLQTAISEGRR